MKILARLFEFEENIDEEILINIDNVIKLCRQNNIIPETTNLNDLKIFFGAILNDGNDNLSKYSHKLYKGFVKNINEEDLRKTYQYRSIKYS